MEQFSLEKWLQDKSRKVVTRDGRPVRIICYDKLDDRPAAKEQKIVALVKEGCKENVFMYNNNGNGCISALDLFFADEEEELTEFEKVMIQFSHERDSLIKYGNDSSINRCTHRYSNQLLDLARKELEKENPYNEKQKQEWSEEDERHRKRIIERLEDIRKSKEDNIDVASVILSEINWLKSIKPQPKYKWTDEDEKNLKDLLAYGETKLGLRRWIAGLPEKLGSRSEYHWKPSEEQMEALFEAKLASIKNREYYLGLLYEDLKKL